MFIFICTRCLSPPSSILRYNFMLANEPANTAAGSPDEIAKLFSSLYSQPSTAVLPSAEPVATKQLKINVVLPGGQAPGGQLICGIFDYLQERAKGSTMYGFQGGPAGVMRGNYVDLTTDFVYPYRN